MSHIVRSFYNNSRIMPEKTAIWCDGSTMNYAQLASLTSRWARGMARQGVRRGEHIGVLLPNSIEFVALMLVAADLGAVLVPLNTSLPVSAVHCACKASDVRHVVAKSETLKVLSDSETDDFSFVDGLWLSLDNDIPGFCTLRNLLNESPVDSIPMMSAEEDDPLILTMTSGSTGDPKPIVLTQRTKFNRAVAAVELYGITSSDVILAATPLYHSLAERLVLIPLLTGGTSILMARYSPSEWLRCVNEHAVSFTIAVSSQLRQIAELITKEDETRLGSLRCIVSSSAQLEDSIKIDLLSKLHCQFHECYGTSEIAIASNLNVSSAQTKLKSVGKAAPGVEIKILQDDAEIAAHNTPGEIVCKTPMIFGGYFKRPDLTTESMWGDFFRTGDIGMLDEDGYLYYLGRTKDVIITGGINVYPKDIESILTEHPSILECSAFPLPDDNLGEVVAVAIVPRWPQDFNQREIKIYCAERLADFQQPRKYFVIEELPKNSMGKILKRMLPTCCGL